MATVPPRTITRLLRQAAEGEPDALDALAPRIYGRLRRMAAWQLRGERKDHTLEATALANEAWIKLTRRLDAGVVNRAHFFSTACRALRNILVDHARKRVARGGGQVNEDRLGELPEQHETHHPLRTLALNEALERLEAFDARLASVVDLRAFGCLTIEETADALGLSKATVKRHWNFARAWLYREIGEEEAQSWSTL